MFLNHQTILCGIFDIIVLLEAILLFSNEVK